MTTRLLVAALLLLAAAPLSAQGDTAHAAVDTSIARPRTGFAPAPALDTVRPMSPRGALIRSMILPGWGQSAFGAYFRGGVYFAGWAGDWYMNFRNQVRLNEAEQRFGLRQGQVADSLVAASPNPDSMRAQIDSFPNILDTAVRADDAGNNLRRLVSSRKQQRQDWIAWSLFWLLASGVDAYVTAQLSNFPAAVEVEPRAYRTVSVGVRLTVPRRRP